MKHTVVMPKMSMTMEKGELLSFLVSEGDEVKAGDVLFEVMTDKIDMEVDAPADGKIEKILATSNQILDVGQAVLIMETTTQVLSFDLETLNAEIKVEVKAENPIIKSVPAARNLAEESGIDLIKITPTGPFQTITFEDVTNAEIDPKISKRKDANKHLIANGIEQGLQTPQISFSRKANWTLEPNWQVKLISNWAQILRTYGESEIGVVLIIESKYGSALPVFKNPDKMLFSDLVNLVNETTMLAKNGKLPLSMLNGGTTTIFDLTNYQLKPSKFSLLPNHSTGLTIGKDSEVEVSLTINLHTYDFYDGASILEKLSIAL